MGQPQRESFDAGKDYTNVLWIAGRLAQDWGLNEMQDISALAHARMGGQVFEHGGILEGVESYFPAANQIGVTEGAGWFFDRVLRIPATVLTYAPATSGISTVYARLLKDQITVSEDASLVSPVTGDPVEERIRTRLSLVTASPDVFNERFERFSGAGVPENWVLSSGGCQRGYPGKFGESGVRLNHTTGTETRIEATLTLAPSTNYLVYFWVRTADGGVDLSLGNGAFVDFERTSPAWSPTDFGFATSSRYIRKSFSFTSDASASPVLLRIVIPAVAPTTQILFDGILVTTSALGALDMERHYVPLLFWDRATNQATRAVARSSRLQMRDLRPPLDGQDIVNIGLNQSLLDTIAVMLSDAFGSFRVPPSLAVTREEAIDDSTHVGVRVSGGRAYISGYRVDAPVTLLSLDKAQTTAHIDGEGATAFLGTQFYPLAKAVGTDGFPIAAVTQVLATVELVKTLTKGVADGIDDTGEVNVVTVLSVAQGTQAQLTGTGTTFTFEETTNTFKMTVSNYDGTAGAEQTLVFARGTYTLTEVLEALSRGSGRAYRSGKITGNVIFESDGSGHVRIKTKTRATEATITIGGAPSTVNSVIGLTNSATASGTGTRYIEATDWARSGNAVDWLTGAAEPTEGTTYAVVLRKNVTLTVSADYKLGGAFASQVDRYYKVAALSTGVGLASAAVHRVTPIGSINDLSWASVANSTSYNVYRSDNGGTNYYLLKNVTTNSCTDDGSLTPDTGVIPSTVSGTTTGSTGSGATTVAVGVDPTTLGFAAAGKAYLNGTDEFTYSGVSGTGFTGVTGVDATHATSSVVTAAPAMGTLTLSEGLLGTINLSPQGQEPVDNTNLTLAYDYYQPRIDVVVVSSRGAIFALKGTPADRPFPRSLPGDHLQIAQVTVRANSTILDIINETGIDRLTMRDLQGLSRQQRQTRQTQEEIIILQELDNRVSTAKTGRFADGLATGAQLDPDHPLWDAVYYQAARSVSVPRARSTLSLTVNNVETTAVQYGGKWYPPSTEVVHIDQDQWSDTIGINPYEAFSFAPPEVTLQPNVAVWTQRASSEDVVETALSAFSATLDRQNYSLDFNIRLNGITIGSVSGAVVSPGAAVIPALRDITVENAREIIRNALNQQGAQQRIEFQTTPILIRGKNYLPTEDNIAATFQGLAVTLSPSGTTVAGTNAGTVKADAVGRWEATFTIPTGVLAASADVRAVGGGGSIARGTFTFSFREEGSALSVDILASAAGLPSRCPVAQSDFADEALMLSAVGLYFATKSGSVPVEVRIQELIAGVPGGRIFASKVLAPSEISIVGETKVVFDDYVYIPAGQAYAFVILCPTNSYTLQIATLGQYGRNPQAPITGNPYAKGVLFASSDGRSWTIFNESDLRYKIYKRSFTPGILEFNPVSSVNLSDIWLGAQEYTLPGTLVSWEYEINGNGQIVPFGALQKTVLPAIATSIKLRARLSTAQVGVAPAFASGGFLSLVGFLNDTEGVAVWRKIEYSQNLASAKLYIGAHIPNGAAIAWKVSNDDGATWVTATPVDSRAVDTFWTEYELTATFADNTKRNFRLRADMTGASPLRPPLASTIGVVLQ